MGRSAAACARPLLAAAPSGRETDNTREADETHERPAFSRGEVIVDLSRFAVVFIFVSGVILLYMLLALSYIAG